MTQNAILAIGTWGLTLYLLWNMQKINTVYRAMQGIQVPSASWLGRIIYLIAGVTLASVLFAGAAVADGVSPFDHIQNILSKQPVMQPLKPKETIVFTATPTATSTPTGTSIPTPMPIPSQTPTLAAVVPSPVNLLPTPSDDDNDKTPGWMKTPNGNGQGQFQTPPGQGGIPPGQQKQTSEPNQPKPTKDNSNNSNNGNGSGKK